MNEIEERWTIERATMKLPKSPSWENAMTQELERDWFEARRFSMSEEQALTAWRKEQRRRKARL